MTGEMSPQGYQEESKIKDIYLNEVLEEMGAE